MGTPKRNARICVKSGWGTLKETTDLCKICWETLTRNTRAKFVRGLLGRTPTMQPGSDLPPARRVNTDSLPQSRFLYRGYGAMVARLTPDQKVGRSNRSGLILANSTNCYRECQRRPTTNYHSGFAHK